MIAPGMYVDRGGHAQVKVDYGDDETGWVPLMQLILED